MIIKQSEVKGTTFNWCMREIEKHPAFIEFTGNKKDRDFLEYVTGLLFWSDKDINLMKVAR